MPKHNPNVPSKKGKHKARSTDKGDVTYTDLFSEMQGEPSTSNGSEFLFLSEMQQQFNNDLQNALILDNTVPSDVQAGNSNAQNTLSQYALNYQCALIRVNRLKNLRKKYLSVINREQRKTINHCIDRGTQAKDRYRQAYNQIRTAIYSRNYGHTVIFRSTFSNN